MCGRNLRQAPGQEAPEGADGAPGDGRRHSTHADAHTHAWTHKRRQRATALRWAVSVKKLRRADGRASRLECSELAGAWGPACFHREHLGSPPLELAPCQATSGSRWWRPCRPLTPLRILRLCLSDRRSWPSSVCPRVSESARNPGGRGCSLSGQTASLLTVCGKDDRFPRARRSQLRQARCVRGGHAVPPEALGAGTTRRAGPRACCPLCREARAFLSNPEARVLAPVPAPQQGRTGSRQCDGQTPDPTPFTEVTGRGSCLQQSFS